MGDHTESFQVDFDPSAISYDQLLDLFWSCHNPCGGSYSRQYMSAVFAATADQTRAAEASKARLEKRLGTSVKTPILPLGEFTLAEDYHQKYYLKQWPLFREFQALYPDAASLTTSTAAARVNGYIGGDGNAEQLKTEIDRLGLSAESRSQLLQFVR